MCSLRRSSASINNDTRKIFLTGWGTCQDTRSRQVKVKVIIKNKFPVPRWQFYYQNYPFEGWQCSQLKSLKLPSIMNPMWTIHDIMTPWHQSPDNVSVQSVVSQQQSFASHYILHIYKLLHRYIVDDWIFSLMKKLNLNMNWTNVQWWTVLLWPFLLFLLILGLIHRGR